MELIYRKAESTDIDQISSLITDLIGTCDFYDITNGAKSTRVIKKMNTEHVKFNMNNYFVCVCDNKILGACGISNIKKADHYGLKLKKYREIFPNCDY